MLLLDELRKSPSEKSAGRQCSNEPGIKTPSGTLYLCGFGDASLRKHSTIHCGLRLYYGIFNIQIDYTLKAFHDVLWVSIKDRLIDFLDFFLGLRGGGAFCAFSDIRKCIYAYVFVCS